MPTALTVQDPYLAPHAASLKFRADYYTTWKEKLGGDLQKFAEGYKEFGFQVAKDGSVGYKEWAPNCTSASLVGDFNSWDVNAHPMKRDNYGVWQLTIPSKNGKCAIPHNSKIKVTFQLPSGERVYRLPAWITRVTQDLSVSPVYDGNFWNPEKQYVWKNKKPAKPTGLRIYEAHVGISSTEPKVASYDHFRIDVLPRIAKLGYNTIQLMAIMEHPYYASFGYQVTSFFAASSRYGTPEELKHLIDTAHGLGLTVLLDLVHSHAASNVDDGLNNFDGTDHCYFHSLPKGRHELWDSRLFNYASYEVLRFLLSNVKYWMDVYQFDGYRFDGVSSMLYHHHGIATGFSGNYNEYFGMDTDVEALGYLMLANDIVHKNGGITIAEDVSGMPTLCRPTEEGGIGFDYRLAMAVPDLWIKYLKEKSDSEWDIGEIVHTLVNRRHGEKHIAYAESHDQALVGDKTLAFWLMDKEMYEWMTVLKPETPIIDRGIALHKMIRLLTYGLGGEGYLNFIGNEFGHPEWLDFPRAGNDNSFHYARRQFNLPDNKLLRYQHLNNFDGAMHHLEEKEHWLNSSHQWISTKHQDDKIVVFERGEGLVWAFNFHGTKSFDGYKIGVLWKGKYQVILSSDDSEFGGHNRVDKSVVHETGGEGYNGRPASLQIYLPTRTAIILKKL